MKVLVVEDDEAIGEALVSLLEDAGHEAVCASDGLAALETMRTGGEPCVILLDLAMPGMNGWQFREAQRRDDSLAGIPVILCTADARAEEKAREIGAADWLRKPLDPDRLLQTVARHCRPAPGPS